MPKATRAAEKTVTKTSANKGLKVERVFTTPGTHPYDEVAWESRDVVMTNWRDGSINFEQRGVEFPSFWSQNATQIVTSKYFRGAVGTPQRETGLKQVIDRVVQAYHNAGEKYGYFATAEDAQIFADELTWLLLHQYFSFNSPVWFNVGTAAPQQVSACQPYGALVSTPAGPIPIGKLVEDEMIGAKVYDAEGLTRILAVKANGVKDVLRLHTKSGHALDVTADHLVWKATGEGTGRFVEAGTLRENDQLEWHRWYTEGEEEFVPAEVYEAALAGWLQADGFVGQYAEGTNRSLTIEAVTVTEAEHAWVLEAVEAVFPGAHYKVRDAKTQDEQLDCKRIRLYGEHLRPFIERWGLLTRGVDMTVPERLYTAPLPVVKAYLRSIFQAEGFVSARERSTMVGCAMISEGLIRGMQELLQRFAIFSRVTRKSEPRANRHDTWHLGIQNDGDRGVFATEIGFVCERKHEKLVASFDKPGRPANGIKRLQIACIEHLGPQEVYDIQTESGEYLSHNLRVHNCFILSVDDTMESILDWYKEEGMIFKGGSGAGINLSKIRASAELLSSGGNASGPISFMRGADASAGTIKSGGATRRAAKMVVLDVDHPDIEAFIDTKAREEDKIRALRDAGFDVDLGGEDMFSVQYQNANNSVRVSDVFMKAVEAGTDYPLTARLDGSEIGRRDAGGVFRRMAQAAWECADPGIQYDDTINDWHTNPNTDRIHASNPCSEYMSLDDSSCNLASLNLMKFLGDDGSFDVDRFVKTVEFVITAMEISISFADFPTEKIGETTRDYRQLGIGYSNLGALLMTSGHAYDSAEGRALAAAITALMTGVSYRRSAEIAGAVGPYAGYEANAEPHRRVMAKHAAAADAVAVFGDVDATVLEAAKAEWARGNELGAVDGWRNAQASVLAPTGTISFMMDCDTTGIEPDLALVKHKKLVGGGSMEIVNQSVPAALRNLGYGEDERKEIVDFIAEHGHVVGAPHLSEDHYPVFDCAMGERAISPMGHVHMMAAVQPFLSGAISKTVNVPESATVEDIEEVYFQGWKLGLKALAIYRDNCKVGQPLSAKKKDVEQAVEAAVEQAIETVAAHGPVRRKLPKKRPSQTISFTVGGAEGYMTSSSYPDDGLGEVFLKMSKQGSTLAGVMDALSVSISIALQYGVPLEKYVEKFTNMRFEPAGMTDDPDIRMASSVVDYIFRRLALDYLPYEERAAIGVLTTAERTAELNGEDPAKLSQPEVDLEALRGSAPVEDASEAEEIAEAVAERVQAESKRSRSDLLNSAQARSDDAPLCMNCGTKMRPAGSCYACEGCGATSGCS
ncbi:vitamin B12-dependent ribonucleotide reductase [Glycomyces sp. A-F 0318]|uniref:vitamin B12-dependent ribonucleotide reductase n=1 Tax=Glycomyces amatae TaxID=2881355 RepID=UPI001E3BFA9F|nr:vitamin B12-dependent ribonucleotide reductase [Glycomyces amatae]MCD0442740.1 vitamin B12-dependent ribonucleotide reductase [Glycomyces amatae]